MARTVWISSSAAIAKIAPWSIGTVSTGVLMLAQTLATERHNGARLRDLHASDQRDLCIDAAGQMEWYAERKGR